MDVTGLFAHIPPWPCPAQQTLPEPWKAGRWLTLVLGRIKPLNPQGEELYPWEEEGGGEGVCGGVCLTFIYWGPWAHRFTSWYRRLICITGSAALPALCF